MQAPFPPLTPRPPAPLRQPRTLAPAWCALGPWLRGRSRTPLQQRRRQRRRRLRRLQLAMKVLRYPDVLALILLVIVLITGMERVSDLIRRSLLRSDILK